MSWAADTTDFSSSLMNANDKTCKKIALNRRRNLNQDQAENLERAARSFRYADCREQYWNPEKFSLLYGTPLWDEASASQKITLNHLFWVAYYSQIISAEIATIYYNQAAAASLYGISDFRAICETLDLESQQERGHIAAFRKVAEAVEEELFGERAFTYPMRGPFAETMTFPRSGGAGRLWKKVQLGTFSLLSTSSAFIGCQYFTIRGLRTLNGKLVQESLGSLYTTEEATPAPTAISYYHYLDESFHFNSSRLISHDVVKMLPAPTAYEKLVVNLAVKGCQKDHRGFSTAINGIFWHDPALMPTIYKILRSDIFAMEHGEAMTMLYRCFAEESDGAHQAMETHETARHSYKKYLEGLPFISRENHEMSLMGEASLASHLRTNKAALSRMAGARWWN